MAEKKKKTEPTYPPMEDVEVVKNLYGILDRYRVHVSAGSPLPIEWLADSLTQGRPLDESDYIESGAVGV